MGRTNRVQPFRGFFKGWDTVRAGTLCGAQERTRTFTAVKPLAPEASASTNSATWARPVGSREPASLKLPPRRVNAMSSRSAIARRMRTVEDRFRIFLNHRKHGTHGNGA